jgi:hypothetical protein
LSEEHDTPTDLYQAVQSTYVDSWQEAINTKIERILQRKCFEICDEKDQKDPMKKAIKSKFVFRLKPSLDNKSYKFKASMVACSYSQKYGRDYEYTFASTAKWKSMCILLHLAAVHGWDIKEIYVYLLNIPTMHSC